MLQQLLLVFTTIGVVCCQTNCPVFSAFKNDVSILNELNGTFYKIVAAGTSVVADCQQQAFTIGTNNIINGYLKSPNWCLQMNNCDSSNPNYYQCDLTPLTSGVATLPATQRNSIKLVGKIGSGDHLCLLYSYCRISEEGAYVLCRQKANSFLSEVIGFLEKWVNAIRPSLYLTQVNQANCIFLNSCPP